MIAGVHMARKMSSDRALTPELLHHLVRKQEIAWENAEAAVQSLERRLTILERSDSMNKAHSHVIPESLINFSQAPSLDLQTNSPVSVPSCNCIYLSPVYDDKRGNITYRTQVVDDGPNALQSKSFAETIRDDEKDLELKILRLDMQRQDIEIRKLKTELCKLRNLDFEDDRNISDKHVDKVNTVGQNTHTVSRLGSYQESLQTVKSDMNSGLVATEGATINSKGHLQISSLDRQGPLDSHFGTHWRGIPGMQGSFKPSLESIFVKGRREHFRAPSAGSELDRYVSSSDCSNSSSMVQQLINSLLSTLQVSVDNLCNNIKLGDPRDCDSSKIDSGAIDDELFILKKTLSRLQDVCHDMDGHGLFNMETRKCQIEKDKLENLQMTVDRMLNQLAQAEFKVISLESSCIDRGKRVEDLENQLHAALKEKEALVGEKYEMMNVIRKMQQEAAEQRLRIEELLSINEELLEISQAEENKLGVFQEARDRLLQQVVEYKDNCSNLELMLREKEKELDDLNRRLKAGQLGADSIIFEKFELLGKIQVMQAESEGQRKRIDELVSINEELLKFAQNKEDQLQYLNKEMDRLQAELNARVEEHSQIHASEKSYIKDG
ncbi:hypothetical protein KP509_25G025800 [Ceratopteris richardii]|nr:hypothetical protein KP509_25G025800 [Ceratopteris richardii]